MNAVQTKRITRADVIQHIEQGFFAVVSGVHGEFSETPYADDTDLLRASLEAVGFTVLEAEGAYFGQHERTLFVPMYSQHAEYELVEMAAKMHMQTQFLFGQEGSYFAPYTMGPKADIHFTFSQKDEVLYFIDNISALRGYTRVRAADGDVVFTIPDLYDAEGTYTVADAHDHGHHEEAHSHAHHA